MRKIIILFFVIICLGFTNMHSQISAEDGSGIVEQEKLQERINALIKALGSEQAKAREEATEELKKIGEPARPALKEAAKSEDPEVAWRAKIIIRTIEKTTTSAASESSEKNKIRPAQTGRDQKTSTQKFSSNNFRLLIPGQGTGQSVNINMEPSGKVTVSIAEFKNGKETTNTYSAENIEEFKQKYPEITQEYGLDQFSVSGQGIIELPEIELDEIWEDFDKSWGRRWDGFNEQMKRMDEMMKRFENESKQNWSGEKETSEWTENIIPDLPNSSRLGDVKTDEFGVKVEFIEPALRAQLSLVDDIGVLVNEVGTGSP
ncbi:MAG: HEAT repeat domain-containing protein, partial [Planctomycetota bacterium]